MMKPIPLGKPLTALREHAILKTDTGSSVKDNASSVSSNSDRESIISTVSTYLNELGSRGTELGLKEFNSEIVRIKVTLPKVS
jgi:hypothetical protein